jgi:hypothetical protein
MKKTILVLFLILSACASPSHPSLLIVAGAKIQDSLNSARAGDTITVPPGTYNEALTLKTSGTASAPITLRCETPLGCTVNSGASKTLVTVGNINYYVIDGFRFVSTATNSENDSMPSSVNLSNNYWGTGDTGEKGNDGFILRNCYVEGAVYLYGSDNLVENCELNGRGVVANGMTERSRPSENNIFRNNVIHDYTQRGGWTLQRTHNSLWQNNTIYNIGANSAIDCDGAGSAVYGCNLKSNIVYNVKGAGGFLLENSFDSVVENNVVRDSNGGIQVINYNKTNADGFKADDDYIPKVTNTIIKNNVFYNLSNAGLNCYSAKGNTFINNTIYKASGYGLSFQTYSNFPCPDWVVKNNIVAQSSKTIYFVGNPAINMDNNFYDVFSANVYNSGNKTLAQWQAMGKDVNSKMGSPLFVNAAAGDFHLQTNSPACGFGAYACGAGNATETPTATRTANPPTFTHTPNPATATPTKTSTVAPATNTRTATRTPVPPTATRTFTRTPTQTFTASPTPTFTATTDATLTATLPVTSTMTTTPTLKPTITTTPIVTPTPTYGKCDFDKNGRITFWEWIRCIFG